MQDQKAKMEMLKQLMDMMDGHRLGKLKRKGEPAAMSVEVTKAEPMELDAPKDAETKSDEMDEDTIRQLVEMYGKKDEDPSAELPASLG